MRVEETVAHVEGASYWMDMGCNVSGHGLAGTNCTFSNGKQRLGPFQVRHHTLTPRKMVMTNRNMNPNDTAAIPPLQRLWAFSLLHICKVSYCGRSEQMSGTEEVDAMPPANEQEAKRWYVSIS